MAISSVLGSSALLPAGLGFRNVLINGEFRINQRAYASASNLASGSYGFDRWKSTFTNTTLTFTSASQGQIVTINSGGSIEQIIERENITAGTYILSWIGTATGRVYNTGATPPSYAASPIVVTLDGLANVEVEFTASGGTRTLWKPQLEQNRQPTPFEQRPIGTELSLCQRYYINLVSGTSKALGIAYMSGTTTWEAAINFPQYMRTAPTLAYVTGGQYYGVYALAVELRVDSMTLDFATPNACRVYGSIVSASSTNGAAGMLYTRNASSFLSVQAEL